MTVGERIKNRRKRMGVSAEEISKVLGVSAATVYRYENGDIDKIPGDRLKPIADLLSTTPAYLMGWDDPDDAQSVNGIAPFEVARMKKVPILGQIAAGTPIWAEENVEGYVYADLNPGGEYFALRVKGDSMDAAGISDGYTVIIRQQPVVENGQIAACLIDGDEATLKRYYRKGHIITLMPQSTNPKNQPFVFDVRETRVEILGLAVRVQFEP